MEVIRISPTNLYIKLYIRLLVVRYIGERNSYVCRRKEAATRNFHFRNGIDGIKQLLGMRCNSIPWCFKSDNGFFLKAQVCIECIVNLFANHQCSDDKKLGDDKL